MWEGLRGVGEVWNCPLVSCLSVQVLKALNSRSSVRELSLEDLYHNTLLCSSCHVLLVYSIVVIRSNELLSPVVTQWE